MRRLSDEDCRILIAAEEGRVFLNANGRYEIEQEERPDRRTRENLKKRGLLSFGYESITEKGSKALRAEITKRREASNQERIPGEPCECGRPTSVCQFSCDFCTGGVVEMPSDTESRNLDGTNHWTPHDDPRGIGR